ncbi:MAG TPA: formylmethanofuran dehydrogenase subunit B [Pirellulales bacterium]|nr:formylmethanofuran dehydrogenase subunit B [Pirellulales bacterium]
MPPRTIADATCTYCTCMCDDIVLTVEENRVVAADNACPLGRQWFLQPRPEDDPAFLVEGRPTTADEAYERALQILTTARAPLVYGLTETTSETQRVAVAIADWLGATLDTGTSMGHAPSVLALQRVGKSTCSLGEISNRSTLLVFWGTNCFETHPRLFSKYTALAQGQFVTRGRADRTCVAIDVRPTKTSDAADIFLQIKPDSDFEALWTLRALLRGLALDADEVLQQTGVTLAAWTDLVDRMKQARYGAILMGMGLMRSRGRHLNCEAALLLTRELNASTRFVLRSVRARGNVTGGDKLVGWRTGFPYAVNLARGYPRYNPGEYTAQEVLSRGEADAALLVATDPFENFNDRACRWLRSIPSVYVGAPDREVARQATVSFATATYGIHAPGTVYRMDDVPLRLRPALESRYATDLEVLSRIERSLTERRDSGSSV